MRRGPGLTSGLITGLVLAAAAVAPAARAMTAPASAPVTAAAAPAPAPLAARTAARPAASGSDKLSSVSCTSSRYCIAVGTQHMNSLGVGTSLALAWNGRGWQVLPTPDTGPAGSSLAGVDCVSARRCVAVGSAGQGQNPLAERWNGTTWRKMSVPSHTGALDAVSCTSAKRCMAVGADHYCELAEQWNGTSWRVLSTPQPCGPPQSGGLSGVSCRSASSCRAVGTYLPDNNAAQLALAESWNGRKWARQVPASPGDLTILNSVACVSGTKCLAVGGGVSVKPRARAELAELWNGSAWALLSPAHKAPPAGLTGVTCLRASWCMAAGSYTRGGAAYPQGQLWNGAIWHAVRPANAPGTLSGLSCTARDRCLAVGATGPDDFAAVWNGSRWRSVTSVPSP